LPHLIKEKPAMSKKFEQLLDYLVNEEMDKANELFHEIVVEKSREIYENMIAEEAEDEPEESVEEESYDEDAEESVDEDDESLEETYGMDEADDETSMSIGGDNDPGDSLPADVQDPEMGDGMADDMDDSEDVSSGEGQILDILAQLKSEFEEIVAKHGGDGGEEMTAEPEFGSDSEEDEPEDDDSDEEGEPEDDDTSKEEAMGQPMREYVENVGMNWEKGNTMKSPGPVGSGTGDKAGQTAVDSGKSPVSSGKGKPTTGATAHNILGSKKTDGGANTGTTPNGKTGGLAGSVKGQFTGSGTHNVNNVKSGIKTLGKVAQNSKAPGPVGSGTGDKAGQTSVGVVKSPLNGAPNRNA
jgi:hypothetical protein